ncbi:hypothetical protein GCM10009548_46420 [Streptomyces malaysiensis subsp. malaysiensis]
MLPPSPPLPVTMGSAPGPRAPNPEADPRHAAKPHTDTAGKGHEKGREPQTGGRDNNAAPGT